MLEIGFEYQYFGKDKSHPSTDFRAVPFRPKLKSQNPHWTPTSAQKLPQINSNTSRESHRKVKIVYCEKQIIFFHLQETDRDLLLKTIRNTGLGVLVILKEYNLNISEINGKTSKDSQRATSKACKMANPKRLLKTVILQQQNPKSKLGTKI